MGAEDETPDPLAQLDAFARKLCGGDFGRDTRRGFIAGFATRHYFRPTEFGIEDDVLDVISHRHIEIFRVLESLLEGDDKDGLAESVSTMFDPTPTEHEDDDPSNPE